MSSEWLRMHSKTVDNVVLEIEKVKMRNTITDEINLNIINFVILGLRNELIKEINKNQEFDAEVKSLNQRICSLQEEVQYFINNYKLIETKEI